MFASRQRSFRNANGKIARASVAPHLKILNDNFSAIRSSNPLAYHQHYFRRGKSGQGDLISSKFQRLLSVSRDCDLHDVFGCALLSPPVCCDSAKKVTPHSSFQSRWNPAEMSHSIITLFWDRCVMDRVLVFS
jgi:hypothetical protein